MQKFITPPIFLKKIIKERSIIAKRPKILNIKKIINGRDKLIMSIDNAEQIKKISLISTGSKTHAQGSEPKFALLDFVKLGKNTISVKLPENKNFIQNGSYMLFAINNKKCTFERRNYCFKVICSDFFILLNVLKQLLI